MGMDNILNKDIFTLLWEYKEAMILIPLWQDGQADQEMLGNCNKQLKTIQALVESLRKIPRIGEKMYWIIHCTYLSDLDTAEDGIDAILEDIAQRFEPIPRTTCFRLKDKAIAELERKIDFLIKCKKEA